MAECESLGRLARPSGFVGAAAEQQDDKTMRQRDGSCRNKATELRDDLQRTGSPHRNRVHKRADGRTDGGRRLCVLYIPRPEGHWDHTRRGIPALADVIVSDSARRAAPLFALGGMTCRYSKRP
jgi:hypothetical protein